MKEGEGLKDLNCSVRLGGRDSRAFEAGRRDSRGVGIQGPLQPDHTHTSTHLCHNDETLCNIDNFRTAFRPFQIILSSHRKPYHLREERVERVRQTDREEEEVREGEQGRWERAHAHTHTRTHLRVSLH